MTLEEIIVELRARASQTVPFAGMAIGELQRGASYAAGKNGTLGVPVFWSGGKLRTASIAIAKVLGVEDRVAPKTDQPAEATPLAAATPAIQLATKTAKPAPQPTTRKSPIRETPASSPQRLRPARKLSKQREHEIARVRELRPAIAARRAREGNQRGEVGDRLFGREPAPEEGAM
jgi:hypothetical protein